MTPRIFWHLSFHTRAEGYCAVFPSSSISLIEGCVDIELVHVVKRIEYYFVYKFSRLGLELAPDKIRSGGRILE